MFSPGLFKKRLAEALRFLQLENLGLTPASFRAGGATAMLERGVAPNVIKFRGCWTSEKSMACYLQEAEAAASLLTLSPSAASRLQELSKSFGHLRGPPAVSFRDIRQRWIPSAFRAP